MCQQLKPCVLIVQKTEESSWRSCSGRAVKSKWAHPANPSSAPQPRPAWWSATGPCPASGPESCRSTTPMGSRWVGRQRPGGLMGVCTVVKLKFWLATPPPPPPPTPNLSQSDSVHHIHLSGPVLKHVSDNILTFFKFFGGGGEDVVFIHLHISSPGVVLHCSLSGALCFLRVGTLEVSHYCFYKYSCELCGGCEFIKCLLF